MLDLLTIQPDLFVHRRVLFIPSAIVLLGPEIALRDFVAARPCKSLAHESREPVSHCRTNPAFHVTAIVTGRQ